MLVLMWIGLAVGGDGWCGQEPLAADRGWRPSVSGAELVAVDETGLFKVHYTVEGDDAPRGTVTDGVPDMVPRVIEALQEGRAAYEQSGWRKLSRDNGDGDDDAIDVYITQIDAFGYANSTPSDSGDGSSCFLRLDPDLPSLGAGVVESVTFHELHHCVQYRYTTETAPWIYEAQATLEQYRLDDNAASDVFVDILWIQRLTQPERGLDEVGARFEYAGFVFAKFWEENKAGASSGRELWSALSTEPEWRGAFERASLDAFSVPFSDTFLEYAIYNGFACANDDGQHYQDVPAGCTANVSVPIVDLDGARFDVDLPGLPFTASYVQLLAADSSDAVSVSCDGLDPGEELLVAVVARDAQGVSAEVRRGRGGAALTSSIDPDGSVLIVLASTGDLAVQATCVVEREPVNEPSNEGCGGCSGAAGAPATWWSLGLLFLWRRRA